MHIFLLKKTNKERFKQSNLSERTKGASYSHLYTKGFTLIELLIVIGIIGVLSSVVLGNLHAASQKADDSKRIQDMQQVKTALELYAGKNGYVLPMLAEASYQEKYAIKNDSTTINVPVPVVVRSLLGHVAYADVVHTETACLQFDQLATLLMNQGLLTQIPHDPQDAPTDTCYKAFSIDTDGNSATAEAVTAYTLMWEKYKIQTNGVYGNKKVGFIFSKNAEVGGELAADVCTVTGEYPTLDLSQTYSLCTRNLEGKIADKVLGVTEGVEFTSSEVASDTSSESPSDTPSDQPSDTPSDTPSDAPSEVPSDGGSVSAHCSNPNYTSQSECERDRSNCSDPYYTDQGNCTNNGSYIGSYCSDSTITDPATCTNQGHYEGGYCNGGLAYNTESLCTSAGYTSDGTCSGGSYGMYTTKSSCEDAGTITPGYCDNSSYSDSSSCTEASFLSSAAHCSDWSSSDSLSCENSGHTWYEDQYSSWGYQWHPEQLTRYGYSWTDGVWTSYGYIWYAGTYVQNVWYQGAWTSNTWNSIPPSTWYQ
jgi:prepilin-type N-terminal cleavage/methylation domain-containing protein